MKKPTEKQKMVAKDLLENVGKPVSKAMLDAGYKPTTAKNPDHLTNSKGWKELMDKYLPDEKLAIAHAEGLEANRIHGTNDNFIEIPDHPTRLKAVELGYKLKGKIQRSEGQEGLTRKLTIEEFVKE